MSFPGRGSGAAAAEAQAGLGRAEHPLCAGLAANPGLQLGLRMLLLPVQGLGWVPWVRLPLLSSLLREGQEICLPSFMEKSVLEGAELVWALIDVWFKVTQS